MKIFILPNTVQFQNTHCNYKIEVYSQVTTVLQQSRSKTNAYYPRGPTQYKHQTVKKKKQLSNAFLLLFLKTNSILNKKKCTAQKLNSLFGQWKPFDSVLSQITQDHLYLQTSELVKTCWTKFSNTVHQKTKW